MSNTLAEKNPFFASRLKTAREKAGLSQRELAERVGSTPASVSRFESGTRFPGIHLIEKLAVEMNVTVDFLLGHQSPKQRTPKQVEELAALASQLDRADIEMVTALVRALVAHRREGRSK